MYKNLDSEMDTGTLLEVDCDQSFKAYLSRSARTIFFEAGVRILRLDSPSRLFMN